MDDRGVVNPFEVVAVAGGRPSTLLPAIPLTAGALVRQAWGLWWKHLGVILAIVLPISLVVNGAYFVWRAWAFGAFVDALKTDLQTSFEVMRRARDLDFVRWFVLILLQCATAPAVIYAVVESERTGRAPSVLAAWAFGARRWARTLSAWIGALFSVGFGLLMPLVLSMLARHALLTPIVALEATAHGDPRGRSLALTEGVAWTSLGAVVSVFLTRLAALVGVAGVFFAWGVWSVWVDKEALSGPLAEVMHMMTTTVVGDALAPLSTLVALALWVARAHPDDPAWVQRVTWEVKPD